MTQYPARSKNGDAAEYLVAFTVTRRLQWPCRLYGVDLGVDAEMEVLNDQGHSDGDIIKIQIKGIETAGDQSTISIYVDDRHLKYWKRFCLPIIVCCVDLTAQKVYWKSVYATQGYHSGGEAKKVTFSIDDDLLNEASVTDLRTLVVPPKSKELPDLFAVLKNRTNDLPADLDEFGDWETIDAMQRLCDEIEEMITKIRSIVSHFPWRIGATDLQFIEGLEWRIQKIRNDCGYFGNSLAQGM